MVKTKDAPGDESPPPKKKMRGGGRDFVPSEEINPHVRQKDHADLLMVGQIQRK